MMDEDKFKIKELIHIRCLLEGIWLNSKEAKDGVTLKHVEQRVNDCLKDMEEN